MSLPINYEGLRHQIEKLVRENEELKKLVRLIRENHELKSAIKTQAGGLSSGLGEAVAGPPQHAGVFLPAPAAAAATEPTLDELGIMALADMLSSQPLSPAAGSFVNPMSGPLNALLPGPVPLPPAAPFAGLLGAPLGGPLAHPMAGAPGTGLAGGLGLGAAGPLAPSSPLAGSQSNPLVAPLAGPVAVSLSSPLLAAAPPLGVAPSLPAAPPEAPRVRLAEPPRAAPPAPPPAASAGPAAPPKVTFSGDPRPARDPEPRAVARAGSPPRHPHAPPRTSSSPASVHDARGPRAAESAAPRKAAQELDRKAAHRKAGKFPDGARESKQLAWERLVGEIAFQLDRRILSSIFPERVRLYGFTVSNIPEKIIQASLNPADHKLDEELCQTLTQRYVSIMNRLQSLGYNGRVHPALTEQLVNAYGILRERPELAASEGGCYTVDFLQRVLVDTVHPSMLTDALLLLSCLNQLAHDDGKPMFIW
ncbi:speriolin [Perognathus longimembris pacificus]|uniref:speriolin n=1 Tax=Perognathus longimembris pacificus TaxID=214514 RepID=UPI00201917EE|nr:speriolin [Perognathus longimembris pacificus]